MDAYVLECKDRFEKTVTALRGSLSKLRSGRANPAMLEGVKCDYYGEKMDITSLCSISVPEPRQLLIKPYSREDVKTIATAISAANLGVNPLVEADVIRIIVPAMTEEIRKDIVKKAKALGEEAKVAARNIRRDTLSLLKEDDSMSDDYKEMVEKDIQKEVDAVNKAIDDTVTAKTKEVMSI
ncbi:MAG: ribosome recycling factor [Bacilli bacterium]|nr:ribosome recycling factor [Bacilli bacterium]MBO6286744.1 ribosome recycling factor [Bacilli bacterium]